MTKKQFESVCKKILPGLPGFVCGGWLLYARPVSHILRGYCCDGSGFDPSIFMLTVFVLPLYIPTPHLHFNFGFKLKDERGCDKWWSIQERDLANTLLSSIQREGVPFLNSVRQPSEFVALVEQLPGNTNPLSLEAIAYSLAMTDDVVAAQQALERLMKALDRNIAWQSEMNGRAEHLARLLNSDPRQAKQQLSEWEKATMNSLGV